MRRVPPRRGRGDVEPWQQREPGETPADRADRRCPDDSALADDPSDRKPGQVHEGSVAFLWFATSPWCMRCRVSRCL